MLTRSGRSATSPPKVYFFPFFFFYFFNFVSVEITGEEWEPRQQYLSNEAWGGYGGPQNINLYRGQQGFTTPIADPNYGPRALQMTSGQQTLRPGAPSYQPPVYPTGPSSLIPSGGQFLGYDPPMFGASGQNQGAAGFGYRRGPEHGGFGSLARGTFNTTIGFSSNNPPGTNYTPLSGIYAEKSRPPVPNYKPALERDLRNYQALYGAA